MFFSTLLISIVFSSTVIYFIENRSWVYYEHHFQMHIKGYLVICDTNRLYDTAEDIIDNATSIHLFGYGDPPTLGKRDRRFKHVLRQVKNIYKFQGMTNCTYIGDVGDSEHYNPEPAKLKTLDEVNKEKLVKLLESL